MSLRDYAEMVELRFDVPRHCADILDGVKFARHIQRNSLCAQILIEWASLKERESIVVGRLTRREGNAVEKNGEDGE